MTDSGTNTLILGHDAWLGECLEYFMTDSDTNTLIPGHDAWRGVCLGVFYDGFWHKYTDPWSCCMAWRVPRGIL